MGKDSINYNTDILSFISKYREWMGGRGEKVEVINNNYVDDRLLSEWCNGYV